MTQTTTATVIVGTGYGDEGKGKVVDVLAADYDVVCRGQGGANAGHTFTFNGIEVNTHQLPSGITMHGKLCVMGHGMFLDPVSLVEEISKLRSLGVKISPDNLVISTIAHVVLPKHKYEDSLREDGAAGQGSTKAGIAFVAADKVLRVGVRAHEFSKPYDELFALAYDSLQSSVLASGNAKKTASSEFTQQAQAFAKAAKELQPYLSNTKLLIREKIANGTRILLEGAQAFGLDLNHGKYPYVTSSDTTVLGIAGGVGLNHTQIGRVIGVAKAIPSKVGGGPFVTQIDDKRLIELYRGRPADIDGEYGKTTERPRDIGYMDLVLLKEAVATNGIDEIALTKADVLSKEPYTKLAVAYKLDGKEMTTLPDSVEELSRCTPVYKSMPTGGAINSVSRFEDLNKHMCDIIKTIEAYVGVPVTIIGTGPDGRDTVVR